MTLKEKFKNILFVYGIATEQAKIDRCEKIADEFAIGFVEWNRRNQHIFDLSHHSYKELLKIYKKVKGLCG